MSIAERVKPTGIVYPDSDGQPIADNTLQFEWITTIKGGLDHLFRDDPNVFVAGDLLWYPVEGEPTLRCAPDALVAFGRPKGYRGSYQQWNEGDIAPQVVFEILSPGNRIIEMMRKFRFYAQYGVEEYYIFDPDSHELSGWVCGEGGFEEVPQMHGWVSPRLGVRFELDAAGLHLYGPNGQPFKTYLDLARERDEAQHERDELSRQRDAERERAERLAARLRELGVEPE